LAAGYILATTVKIYLEPRIKSIWLMISSLVGAVTPDLDIFYFYLIDNRQHHHHTYWTHYPITWLSLLLVFTVLYKLLSNKTIPVLGLLFSLSGLIHMLLDSIVGDIW
ncbi:MAG: metal-dependent hydrolase, partial [Methylophagaceae bacterium]